MVKQHTSIRVNKEYLKALKENGVKISPLVNEFLGWYVGLINSSEKQLTSERMKLLERIEKDKLSLKHINKKLMGLYDDEGEV